MKKIHVLGVALVALIALGVVASTAWALPTFLLAEWLIDNEPVLTLTSTDSEGELEVVALEEPLIGTLRILCSMLLEGSVGFNGEDEITSVWSLGDVEISKTALVGTALECTNIEKCPSPLVWADSLPWHTVLELWEEGTSSGFVDLISGTGEPAGLYYECMTAIPTNDLCTFSEDTEVTNEASGQIDGLFSDAFQVLMGSKLGSCLTAGTEKIEVNGLIGISTLDGLSLTVSSV